MERQDLEHLLSTVRGALGEQRESAAIDLLDGVHPADVAEIYTLLNQEEQSALIFHLPARTVAEVVAELDHRDLDEVLEELDDATLQEIVSELPPDEAADVLGELGQAQREELLEHMPDEQSEALEELLEYDDDTAGGIMTPELVALAESATVAEAVEQVRALAEDEEIFYVYTFDDQKRLSGLVPLRLLVTNPRQTLLSEITVREPVTVLADEDQESVARKIRKYDISAVPVIDEAGHLLGRVTHDDIMDVAEEEAAEDLYYMAGTQAAELEDPSTARAAIIRLRWLLPCLLGTAVSGAIMAVSRGAFVIGSYEALILFVPMMGAMGGNSGIQISTILVRSLATGDLASTRVSKSMARELPITAIMAPVCGLAAATLTLLGLPMLKDIGWVAESVSTTSLAGAVGVGMLMAISTASVMGMLLPHLFHRVGVDPAIASGPIVTTVNDILSVGVYFLVAVMVLGATV